MDNIIESVITWLSINYPNLILILAIIIVSLYILKQIKEIMLDSKDGDINLLNKIINLFKKNKKKPKTKHVYYKDYEREEIVSELLMHKFFQNVINMKRDVCGMDFGNVKKNLIFRDLIKIYIESIEKHTIGILKNYKLDELNTPQLNNLIQNEVELISNDIYTKLRERLGNDVYNMVIDDPYKGFRIRNARYREIFIRNIVDLSSQSMDVYDYDNYERAREMLTAMSISLQVIVTNFESTFKDFNGELDKIIN